MARNSNDRRDFWYISLVPTVGFVAYFAAWRDGIAPPPPISVSAGSASIQTPTWITNTPMAFGQNLVGLSIALVGMVVGVVLFTWICLLIIDAKRATYRLAHEYRERHRGDVSGVLRPQKPEAWSSALVLDEEPKAYRVRMSSWIRHNYMNDRTSGTLRTD